MRVITCGEHVTDRALAVGNVHAVTLVTLVTLILKKANSIIYGLVLFRNTVTSVTSVTSRPTWPDYPHTSRARRARYTATRAHRRSGENVTFSTHPNARALAGDIGGMRHEDADW